MDKKTTKYLPTLVSLIFSPLLIPLIGFWLLLSQLPGAEFYSFRLKVVLMAIVAITGFFIPLTYILLTALNRKLVKDEKPQRSKAIFYLFTCLSLFLGGQFMSRLPVDTLFKAIMFGGSVVSLIALIVSLKSNLSEHTLAIGAFWGTLLSVNFIYGMNVSALLMLVSIIAGILGSARIYLGKHSPVQVYSGFLIGSLGMVSFFVIV